MRNAGRSKVEYIVYCAAMTTGSIVLGLANTMGKDEEGKRRTPVLDQPLSESLREARIELKEYQDRKAMQCKTWMHKKGYGDWWNSVFERDHNNNHNNAQQHNDYLKGALEQDGESPK